MSGDELLTDADLFTGDPLRPDLDRVCPPTVVATLTRSQREERVERLIEQAHQIINTAWDLAEGRMRAAWCVLYSGGNDSTVLTHLVRDRVDCAVHANTTIGIEETRQFVRNTCAAWGLDLIERTAPTTYRDLVLERGFPGPAMHFKMYQRLKERALDQVRSDLILDSRRQRVLFIAGRRRSESKRRATIPLYEKDGSAIWASPLAMWTKLDMNTYRLMAGDVPINPVSEKLHMSGECLCGSFAKPGELEEIRFWYPETAEAIDQLQAEVVAAGHGEPFCRWGHGQGAPPARATGRLCTSCDDAQFDLFNQAAEDGLSA
ncbi:phosphoadenosine phosphosulfate reductase family protein [Mycolicibacterium sphagni]|uniref:phosphoadenosine phosphosulfate reductase family protein n=1 Tax=Mycolicibacterium sphagni TaxID=1786 RepID=UPI001A9C67C0|nr:phosphoadenosine phosphosulfate reductase family protein [Mycolicibacterium sphagni]